MKTTQLTLQFNTPAFLGNAFQEGQWRTPPFKALLRQWWRVAYAAERGFDRVDVKTMRHEEGMLFGHAWLEDDWHVPEGNAKPVQVHGRQSLVRIRLVDGAAADANAWTLGKQQGSDFEHAKPTYPALLGLEQAKQYAASLNHQAHQALADFDHNADQLRHLADYIVSRRN